MTRVCIGDKVKIKSEEHVYIVEEFAGKNQYSIRKYYQERTQQIDVSLEDIAVVLYSSKPLPNNIETPDDDPAIKIELEMQLRSTFLKFRKKFFNIPDETLHDPFYFCLIPNMTALMMWLFSLSLLVMSSLTVLFCLCPLVIVNPFWSVFCQTVISYFGLVLSFFSGACSVVEHHTRFEKASFTLRFLLVLCNTISVSYLMMKLKPLLSSPWQISFIPYLGYFLKLLWSIVFLQPLVQFFWNHTLVMKTDFLSNQKLKTKHRRMIMLTGFLNFTQLLSIQFWAWAPTQILRVLNHNLASFLSIILLLKISKHGYLHVNNFAVRWAHPDISHSIQLRCRFLSVFAEVLVLSNVPLDDFFILAFFRFIFDFCETFYYATSLSDHDQTKQTFEILMNHRSSYICTIETAEIIVPIYLFIAKLIFLLLGQNEQIWFLCLNSTDTFTSSCVWSMIILIYMPVFNAFLMRQILSRNNTFMMHDRIYLIMSNTFEILFITPWLLVGYLLITCQLIGQPTCA